MGKDIALNVEPTKASTAYAKSDGKGKPCVLPGEARTGCTSNRIEAISYLLPFSEGRPLEVYSG
ncbi:hypothetical protein SAY87_029260 [Trapa incisa]|uniref:Uncharacterized protein n=1 Tax=Trapa incisa TaxID=236973 RepID=A0AAN7QQY5_9MYRT|nr:hypothetical protein SAY87_029260 [Trapa incisa]